MKHLLSIIAVLFIFQLNSTGVKAATSLVSTDYKLETKDTLFKNPYVDIDEWRDKPVRHRYVHGGFKGTETRFSFYFPTEDKYKGRFFHYIAPFPDTENMAQASTEAGPYNILSFTVASNAYFVESNGGGKTDFTNRIAVDPSIGAYRANAASAQFSRIVAVKIFGGKRPYGYCFGGSGGAYRTVGGMENTEGVWDGACPFIMGSPVAIPNVFTVRMHAMRILKDKFPQIVDALEPGGSGDMYRGLNEEEKAALKEVTGMGFPAKSWFAYKSMDVHGFLVLYQSIVMMDKAYFDNDFWNKPGYLGFDSPSTVNRDRIQKASKLKKLIGYDEALGLELVQPHAPGERGSADKAWNDTGKGGEKPEAFQLEDIMPNVQFLGGDLKIKTGDAAGVTLQITKVVGDKVVLAPTNPLNILAKIKPGDEVVVDNSNFLAVQTYHRHQDPGSQYAVWNQFRDDKGNPIYPQRSFLLGPMFTMGASGVLPTGKFKGKVILVGALWDREAFPWQSDWYNQRVAENLGNKKDDNFRLWYIDRATHGDAMNPETLTHTVSLNGVLQQALRDVSNWVENGVAPAPTTNYKIIEGQVVVPASADERKGIQPIITITNNGEKVIKTKKGKYFTLNAVIDIPKNTGKVVAAKWDFAGSGEFKNNVDISKLKVGKDSKIYLKTKIKYSKSGTYFPVLKVSTERNGDVNSPYALIENLDRVRVIVE